MRISIRSISFPIYYTGNYIIFSSRLRTGWSVKTASLGYKSSTSPLREEEQTAIIDVIRRAEQLDLMEQDRVRTALSHQRTYKFYDILLSNPLYRI